MPSLKAALMALYTTTATAMALSKSNSIEKRGVAPSTQSCTTRSHGFVVDYTVVIGINYAGGAGCNDVYNALHDKVATIENYYCLDDGTGATILFFYCEIANGDGINEALNAMYPTIIGGFNCPGE